MILYTADPAPVQRSAPERALNSHTWGCTGFDGGMEAGLAGGGA